MENLQEPITLYYVDDDKDDLDIFELALQPLAGRVVLFEIGADLLASLDKPRLPAIVFVDLNMPFTGFQIIEYIKSKKRLAKLPIVVLSTSIDFRTKQTCWELGADFCIVKPRQIHELTTALQYAINVEWTSRERSFANFQFVYEKQA